MSIEMIKASGESKPTGDILDKPTMEFIEGALEVESSKAVDKAYRYAEMQSKKMLSSVISELEQYEKPEPMVMAVKIDKNPEKKLKTAAVSYLGRMMVHAMIGDNILLTGPTGCGKTFAAHQLAESLGRNFGHTCLTAGASETWLFGRQTPKGFVEAPFSRMYREGGVFLADEMDSSDGNMLLSINTALANGSMFNPISGETIKRHKEFVFIGCANTFGKGADAVYTGRTRLDGATLDRFITSTIKVDYCTKIEKKLCPDDLVRKTLQEMRKKLKKLESIEVISTRTLEKAYRGVSNGIAFSEILESLMLSWSDDLKKEMSGVIDAIVESEKPKKPKGFEANLHGCCLHCGKSEDNCKCGES